MKSQVRSSFFEWWVMFASLCFFLRQKFLQLRWVKLFSYYLGRKKQLQYSLEFSAPNVKKVCSCYQSNSASISWFWTLPLFLSSRAGVLNSSASCFLLVDDVMQHVVVPCPGWHRSECKSWMLMWSTGQAKLRAAHEHSVLFGLLHVHLDGDSGTQWERNGHCEINSQEMSGGQFKHKSCCLISCALSPKQILVMFMKLILGNRCGKRFISSWSCFFIYFVLLVCNVRGCFIWKWSYTSKRALRVALWPLFPCLASLGHE